MNNYKRQTIKPPTPPTPMCLKMIHCKTLAFIKYLAYANKLFLIQRYVRLTVELSKKHSQVTYTIRAGS